MRVARIVRDDLRPLGIRVAIRPSLDCRRGDDADAARADIQLVTRATAQLDPAPFLEAAGGDTAAFGSGLGPVTFDDAGFRGRLDLARALVGEDRIPAYRRLEDELVREEAPYAAFGSFVAPQYLSPRTGCRIVQGPYGSVDVGALCVR